MPETAPRPKIAFYAPMKSPDHPIPSGDREIARLTLRALDLAGFDARVISDLRTLDMAGDETAQHKLRSDAAAHAAKLCTSPASDHPDLWFTYHCYYKAPDLLGPPVARALGIPYAISEPSISPKRRAGPWSEYAALSEQAIDQAGRLFWTTARDRPALVDAGHAAKMYHLPAFCDPGPDPAAPPPAVQLRLLTIAMMRPGDKLESYRRLATALAHLAPPWHLTIIGDGDTRPAVEALFAPFGDAVTFQGATDDRGHIRRACEAADVFVWPGVGEGVGMVYLEAQAAGAPVVAENHPAPAEVIADPCPPENTPAAFARQITALAQDPAARIRARQHILQRHSLSAAAKTLRDILGPLL